MCCCVMYSLLTLACMLECMQTYTALNLLSTTPPPGPSPTPIISAAITTTAISVTAAARRACMQHVDACNLPLVSTQSTHASDRCYMSMAGTSSQQPTGLADSGGTRCCSSGPLNRLFQLAMSGWVDVAFALRS